MKCILTVALLGVAVCHLAQAKVMRGEAPADKIFLSKQREVLKLLNKVHEPNRFKDQADLGRSYDPTQHLSKYKNALPVKTLVKQYTSGRLLPRGRIFTLFNDRQREQMITIFESLFYAEDWDTFYRTACYVRDRVNEGQFVYALSVAVLHREDTRGMVLPPAYEVYPHLFVNSDVIHAAYRAKMRQEPAVVRMNFTGTVRNPEQRVAYLGEDVGINSHHSHWHMDFPFWWKQDEYGVKKDRQGELFYYMHHQLIARLDLERLSNDLPFVKPLYWEDKIEDGFYPQTTYRVGGEFPARPDNFEFQDLQDIKVKDMVDYTRRIREAISQQSVITRWGQNLPLNDTMGINILGSLVEPSQESPNPQYYGALHNYGHILLGQITDPKGKFDMPPGVMEHFETATRDPAFFRLHKYIDNLFKLHKDMLPPYAREELEFPGVAIQDVTVDDLVTYFEDFDIDLLNALDDTLELKDVEIKARVRRLNHRPFTFSITVNSNQEQMAAVRIFLGPKFDWFGQEIPINEKRLYVIELDKFVAKVNKGATVIQRKSSESSVAIPDRETTKILVRRVDDALQGKATYTVNKDVRHCGYPERLLLPKGKRDGMPFSLFVILTDFDKEKVNDLPWDYDYGGSISYCGTVSGHKYPDSKPMGFPFDRQINSDNFFRSNIYQKDVVITFKDSE
uniref:Hemocyanin subunit type 1 n=1 Tax=Cryptotermes secundus TaxID=105785 RepID=B9W4N3_9NEOP|nr:hemocyanin subunit type 1 precursor [Cryptotermes secundus]